jgi:hypothetical protein
MGDKIGSLTIKEAHTLILFENKLLRRTFVLKKDEVSGKWKKTA